MKKNFNSIKLLEIFDEKVSLKDKMDFLRNCIQEVEIEDKEKIISYLKNGEVILLCPGAVMDILSEKEEVMGSNSIHSDGIWIWKDYIAQYLKKYNIPLPLEFILHLKDNNWQPAQISIEREEQIINEILQSPLIEEPS